MKPKLPLLFLLAIAAPMSAQTVTILTATPSRFDATITGDFAPTDQGPGAPDGTVEGGSWQFNYGGFGIKDFGGIFLVFNDDTSEAFTGPYEVDTFGSFGEGFTGDSIEAGDQLGLVSGLAAEFDPGLNGSIEYRASGPSDATLANWTYEIEVSANSPIAPDGGGTLGLTAMGAAALLAFGYRVKGKRALNLR
jgi:hypothetical protein